MWSVKDKVVLITGATNGVGRAAAEELARGGARIIIHGRDREKTDKTIYEIIKSTGNTNIDMALGDFTSLPDVKKMGENIKTRYKGLDVLINNAGGVFMDEKESKDGYDITFQVNYLSHFLLTGLLLPLLKKSAPSRIIHVSSEAHRYLKGIDFNRLAKPGGYSGFQAYSAAKISVNLFAYELAERLKNQGITSNALHPGVVRTGFGLNTHNVLFRGLMHIFGFFLITPDKGAETTVYLASSPEVEGVTGKYFNKCKAVPSAKNSDNKEDQKKLWELGEKLVKNYL